MNPNSFSVRFDKFQKKAVDSIRRDFEENPFGRFLLVIPTGGGKTFTAVKAVNSLYQNGSLDHLTDRVLWIAHRNELLHQAKDTFNRFESEYPQFGSYKENIEFRMIGSIKDNILDDKTTKLVVIDEAHHGAANSYLPIFKRQHLGVLGLTATPTRHDGKPLEFERESFSIGFPDLVELGVVLKPEIRTIKGETFYFSSLNETEDLENLNTKSRNQKIISAINDKRDDYQKVIIYVGTKNHVYELYKDMLASPLSDFYESISFITGDKNSRNQAREEFFSQERQYKKSIIVNVDILTEGYDDPSINTIVMGRPTSSKLIYMQAMGRAIRHDPNNDLKKAFIIEIVDELPNIRYRIDNRWLYSDISDALEPAVIDRQFSTKEDFVKELEEIYSQYEVPEPYRLIPEYNDHYRYSLLLFKVYKGPGSFFHHPVLIDNNNRTKVSNMFNFLSERMRSYRKKQVNKEVVFRMINLDDIPNVNTKLERSHVFDAMENSTSDNKLLEAGYPWITFVTFRKYQDESELSADLIEFISDLINRDEVLEQIKGNLYPSKSVVIKYPLPLAGFIGKIILKDEFYGIKDVVDKIYEVKNRCGKFDHRHEVKQILEYSLLPVEPIYAQSLAQIVREETQYYFQLD
jgi:superfamily II DNA or RNA helicase